MKKRILSATIALGLLASGAMFTNQAAKAGEINATIVAGHPPVFRWVKHVSKTFIPAVNKALEGTDHKIAWTEQYGGSLAKVGDELEAVEEGLAEVGLVSSLFDPAKLSVQNVTYFTPFVSSDSTAVAELFDNMHKTNKDLRASWEANGLEYLGGAIGIDDYLLMTKFPIKSNCGSGWQENRCTRPGGQLVERHRCRWRFRKSHNLLQRTEDRRL